MVKKNPVKKWRITHDKFMQMLDISLGLKDDMKDLTRELKQTYIDMDLEAGEKGEDWDDDTSAMFNDFLVGNAMILTGKARLS